MAASTVAHSIETSEYRHTFAAFFSSITTPRFACSFYKKSHQRGAVDGGRQDNVKAGLQSAFITDVKHETGTMLSHPSASDSWLHPTVEQAFIRRGLIVGGA